LTALSGSKEKKTKSFIGGVAVLTASTAVVKIIGLFYKIPMIYLVGVEGMAYFLAAYHIYTLLFTLSTAGLPIAVSILVSRCRASGNFAGGESVYRIASLLFTTVGAIFTAVLYACAEPIASLIDIKEAADCIRAVAPSLLFVSMGSAVKGYFQGCQNMRPTAVSQIIESVGKLGLGLLFTKLAISRGMPLPKIAAAAIMGLSAGVIISTLYLFACRMKTKKENYSFGSEYSGRKILKELLAISAPITVGSAVISITSLIDTALISSRLQSAGYASSVANAMYSSYGNLSIPIFNLIPAFMAPIAISMAPTVADAASRGDKNKERQLLDSSFKLCGMIAIPSSVGIAVFSNEILKLIFPSEINATSVAAPLLTLLGPAVFFSCLITLTNAALQAYGKASRPIISMAVGAILKMIAEYVLVGDPRVGIFGAPISTLICDVCIVAFNMYYMGKYTCGTGKLSGLFGKSFVSAVISSLIVSLFAMVLLKQSSIGKYIVLPVVVTDAFLYLLLIIKTGALNKQEVELLPSGRKIYKILNKIKLLK